MGCTYIFRPVHARCTSPPLRHLSLTFALGISLSGLTTATASPALMASPTLQPKMLSSPQPPPQTPSRLLSIPLEVLLSITSNLPTPDYCSLRSTCKHVETQLHNAFSREFFTKRQFMISEFSLQSFIDISKSRYSTCLTHVIIGTERIPPPNLHRWATPDSDAPNRRVHGYTDYCKQPSFPHTFGITQSFVSNLDPQRARC